MKEQNDVSRYHVKGLWLESMDITIHRAGDRDLEKWATDPNCYEMEACAQELNKRLIKQGNGVELQALRAVTQQRLSERLSERRQQLQDNPFDPRTEISADATHIANQIVKHLWIIFVLLPFVVYVLLAVVGIVKVG